MHIITKREKKTMKIDGPIRDKPPCKGCTERHTACWDGCEKYKEWKKMVDSANKARKEYNFKAAIFSKIT